MMNMEIVLGREKSPEITALTHKRDYGDEKERDGGDDLVDRADPRPS